jgi:hypothetical protein
METVSPNTRAEPRVQFFEPVRVLGENDQRMQVFGLDLSPDGMRLRSNQAPRPGAKVALEFVTKHGRVRVDQAEVVWSVPFEPINVDGVLPGFGVRFVSVGNGAKETLAGLLGERSTKGERQTKSPFRLGEGHGEGQTERTPIEADVQSEISRPVSPLASVEIEPGPRRAEDPAKVTAFATHVLAGGLAVVGLIGLGIAFRGSGVTSGKIAAIASEEDEIPLHPISVKMDGPGATTKAAPSEKPSDPIPAAKPPAVRQVAKPAPLVAKAIRSVHLPAGVEVQTASDSWTMSIRGRDGIKAKTFSLSNPSRFVIDVAGGTYHGASFKIDPEIKGIVGMRVRAGEPYTRYVLDFGSGKVPATSMSRQNGLLAIRFQKDVAPQGRARAPVRR